MKLLVFEYINGGGFAGQELSPSLLREGATMLQALLQELKSLLALQLIVPLDRRCRHLSLPDDCQVVWMDDTACLWDRLQDLLMDCDAFWPIAPETDGILARLARLAENSQVRLLLSDTATVALCADKWATYQALVAAHIPAVETRLLADHLHALPFEQAVLKPIDGVGCEGSRVLSDNETYATWVQSLRMPESYVVQPFVAGESKSWSALFNAGQGWLLSCNRQQVDLHDQGFCLRACQVNVDRARHAAYQAVIDDIARAMPGLWGYVGIDFIDSDSHGPLVLEINPRLTTSYAGIGQAIAINVAEQVLRLRDSEPCLPQIASHSFLVSIS